jgi:hypothetical protein
MLRYVGSTEVRSLSTRQRRAVVFTLRLLCQLGEAFVPIGQEISGPQFRSRCGDEDENPCIETNPTHSGRSH